MFEDVPAEYDVPFPTGNDPSILDDTKAASPAFIQCVLADVPPRGIRQRGYPLSNTATVFEDAHPLLLGREIKAGLNLGPRPEIIVIRDQFRITRRMVSCIVVKLRIAHCVSFGPRSQIDHGWGELQRRRAPE